MPEIPSVSELLPDLADYIVYAAIAIVTLIGVFKCLVPLWSTRSALRKAITRLQREAGKVTDKPVWQQPMFVGRRLKNSWLRFPESTTP